MLKDKTIAFICPLGDEGSETRKRSDRIFDNIIVPIANDMGYSATRADKRFKSNLMEDIVKMVIDANIVIADLSDKNPNVYYEFGIRNAIKGKCIPIINKMSDLPFDITYFRAYQYDLDKGIENHSAFVDFIKNSIRQLENENWKPCISLTAEEISEIYNVTLLSKSAKGTKDHYGLAKSMFSKPCKQIFLMQRSSSIVLGDEKGWGEEKIFLDTILQAASKCEYFYHIVTLDGIESHFHRKDSVFPGFKNYKKRLKNIDGNTAINIENTSDKTFYLKKLPRDSADGDFKLDRQARVLTAEFYNGSIETVIVQNLGKEQLCFLLKGKGLKTYLNDCISYYESLQYVKWREIQRLYQKYEIVSEESQEEAF